MTLLNMYALTDFKFSVLTSTKFRYRVSHKTVASLANKPLIASEIVTMPSRWASGTLGTIPWCLQIRGRRAQLLLVAYHAPMKQPSRC
ncbi:hypothetical protein M758_UG175400 [Ceratodon purpureus]|nr:hypothetical protein M758_UG175400 [Ceratodon purpureus]